MNSPTKNDSSVQMPRSYKPAETLADRAYFLMEELIMKAALQPGTFVSDLQLSAELGIGRTPVREALKRLEADGLVTSVPSRGIMITVVDLAQELMVLEVRRELERLLAVRASRFATTIEKARFSELIPLMSDAAENNQSEQFMRYDQEFNTLLSTASRNHVLAKSIRPLRSMSRRFWYQHYSERSGSLKRGAQTHTAVMEAIVLGDESLAARRMDLLMDDVENFARATIERFT